MIVTAAGSTAAMVIVLVWSEANRPQLRRLAKMLASTGFVAVALSAGAPNTAYGRWILLGLACAWLGDLLLTVESRSGFVSGLVAFLLTHLMYGTAFLVRGISGSWMLLAAVPVGIAGVAIFRWL